MHPITPKTTRRRVCAWVALSCLDRTRGMCSSSRRTSAGSSFTSWITVVVFVHDLDLDDNNNLGTSFGAGAYSVNPSVIPIFSVSAVACRHGLSIAYVANCT